MNTEIDTMKNRKSNSTRLRHLSVDLDRHGNRRVYFRRDGAKIRLRAPMLDERGAYTAEFMKEYTAAYNGDLKPQERPTLPRVEEGTFEWLCQRYFASPKFQNFEEATQRDKRNVLNRFCEVAGNLPYRLYRREDVERSQQKRAHTPGAADKLVVYLRALFNWAIEMKLADQNPTQGVQKINTGSQGHRTWMPEDIRMFEEYWPVGSKPRLAFALLRYTGVRRSDVVRLGKRTESEGWLSFTEQKGRKKNPKTTTIPIHSELRAILDASKLGDLTYLVTDRGIPYTGNGFGNEFRSWCHEAGLQNCPIHGLRKAAATALAESGASTLELQAIFGWNKPEMAETYTRKADKKRLAHNAFQRLSDEQTGAKIVPLTAPGNLGGTDDGESLEKSIAQKGIGGSDGTRTRGLWRDRPAL